MLDSKLFFFLTVKSQSPHGSDIYMGVLPLRGHQVLFQKGDAVILQGLKVTLYSTLILLLL